MFSIWEQGGGEGNSQYGTLLATFKVWGGNEVYVVARMCRLKMNYLNIVVQHIHSKGLISYDHARSAVNK